MNRMPSARAITLALVLAALSTPAAVDAQSFEVLGTRAAGMGGAFVAVADDATATYWNPAGLATSGRLFNLSIDWGQGHAEPDTSSSLEGDRSAGFVGITTPPLGLSYYRLTSARVAPAGAANIQLQNLVTHHAGITVVQSIARGLAIGTTLKYVHSEAAVGIATAGATDSLDRAKNLTTAGTNAFDADVGVMAVLGTIRAGLTARNLREPKLAISGDDERFQLKRQSRAGVAYVGLAGLIVSADVDLERAIGAVGEERNFAAGAEAHLWPRVFIRSGFRVNTLDDQPAGRSPAYTLGGSVTTFRSFIVDAQVTLGSRAGDRGWGIAGRLTY